MLSSHSHLLLKPETIMKSESSQYSIRSGDQLVALAEETTESSWDWKNKLLNATKFQQMASKHINILTPEAEVLAIFEKPRGYNKEIDVKDQDGTLLATIKPSLNNHTQTIAAAQPDGSPYMRAVTQNDGMDFNVLDEKKQNFVSSIKVRSIPVPTTKELLFSGDQYHLTNIQKVDEQQQLTIIAMAISLNIELHS